MRLLFLALLVVSGCSLTTNLDTLGGGGAAVSAASSGGAGGSTSASTTATTAATGGGTPSGYPSVVLGDNPIAYWRLGEAVGETAAVDQVGMHHGEYIGVVVQGADGAITGDPDTAVEFAPATARGIQVSAAELSFSGRAAMSLELWIAPQLPDTTYRRIVSKESDTGSQEGYQLFVNDSGGLGFARYSGNTSDSVQTEVPALNQYHHLVVTFDGMKMFLYLNGEVVASAVSDELLIDTGTPFTIGAKSDLYAGYGGLIDEVAVYDHALAGVVVVEHYLAGLGAR